MVDRDRRSRKGLLQSVVSSVLRGSRDSWRRRPAACSRRLPDSGARSARGRRSAPGISVRRRRARSCTPRADSRCCRRTASSTGGRLDLAADQIERRWSCRRHSGRSGSAVRPCLMVRLSPLTAMKPLKLTARSRTPDGSSSCDLLRMAAHLTGVRSVAAIAVGQVPRLSLQASGPDQATTRPEGRKSTTSTNRTPITSVQVSRKVCVSDRAALHAGDQQRADERSQAGGRGRRRRTRSPPTG